MPINKDATERIETSKIGPDVVMHTLNAMCITGDLLGGVSGEFKVDYQDANTPVEPGDMIPFIVFGLRPATMPTSEVEA